MKKALSLVLSLALFCTMALPAAAAEGADQRLTQVTTKVKAALDIPDSFDQFSGDLSEGDSSPLWQLRWSGGDESISVTADERGKVLRYQRSSNSTDAYDPSELKLPKLDLATAKTTATAFLDSVLEPGLESATFTDRSGRSSSSVSTVTMQGNILLNKLPSPITFRISVRAADGAVTSYTREDLYSQFLGGVPSAVAKTAIGTAAQALSDTLSLRLEYVQVKPGQPAVLRYLPNRTDDYYVDAQTGKLVNLSQIYDNLAFGTETGGAGDNDLFGTSDRGSAPSPAPESALSQVEQDGISKLAGILPKEALDQAARSLEALGLNAYTLSRFSYSAAHQDASQITALLVYTKSDSDGTWRRNVELDGKTGALVSVRSSSPYREDRKAAITEAAAQAKATAFLTAQQPEFFATTALYGEQDTYASADFFPFLYAQKVNSYFFPQNAFHIQIDSSDGSVSAYNFLFDEVTFEDIEGIISAEQAVSAWFNTYQTPLSYLSVPVKLDPSMPGAEPLMAMGYTYYSTMKLGYALTRETDLIGISAKTGAPVASPYQADSEAISYTDLDGIWGRAQVEELATYGYGWTSGALQPQKSLTQLDLVALLLSLKGQSYDPAEQTTDELYQTAYDFGLLTKAQRQDDKTITRMELLRTLLDQAGYGEVAALQGIYRCDFADAADLSAADLGYAALAQGLGVATGDKQGNLAPARTATRLEALLMLYQLMTR